MPRRVRPRAENPEEPSLPIRNLGRLGVNVVDSPIHLQDGELRQAQNAEPYDVRGEGALRKRLGIDFFTTDALGAAVVAMTSVPLPDPSPSIPDDATTGTRLYWAGDNVSAFTNYTSTDGTTWTSTADPGDLAFTAKRYVFARGGALSTDGLLYYAVVDGGGTVSLYKWDGATRTLLASGAYAPGTAVWDIAVLSNEIYVLITAALLKRNGTNFDTVTVLDSRASSLCPFDDRMYITVGDAASLAEIDYWNGASVVTDITITDPTDTPYAVQIVNHENVLYAATFTHVGELTHATTNRILKRIGDSSWSDISPDANGGQFGPMASFDGSLFVGRIDDGSGVGFTGASILKYNGSTWSTDVDLATFGGASQIQAMRVFNDALYCSIGTKLLRRTTGGVWTAVQTSAGAAGIGFY